MPKREQNGALLYQVALDVIASFGEDAARRAAKLHTQMLFERSEAAAREWGRIEELILSMRYNHLSQH